MNKEQALKKIEEMERMLVVKGGEFGQTLKELKAYVEQEESKEWPKDGDMLFYTDLGGNTKPVAWSDGHHSKELIGVELFFTKEDTKAIKDWTLAQKLTWMPEADVGCETWWCVDGNGRVETWSIRPDKRDLVSGNVHRTEALAEKYAKIMLKAAEVKKKYL